MAELARRPRWSVPAKATAVAFFGAVSIGAAQVHLHATLLRAQLGDAWPRSLAVGGARVPLAVGAVMLAGYALQAAVTWWVTARITRERSALGQRILAQVARGDYTASLEAPPDADMEALHAEIDRMRAALADVTLRLRSADLRRRQLFAFIAAELSPPTREMSARAAALEALAPDVDQRTVVDALERDAARVDALITEVRRLARVEDAELTDAPIGAPPARQRGASPWRSRVHLGTKCAALAAAFMCVVAPAQGLALALLTRAGLPEAWAQLAGQAGLAPPHAALAAAFYALDAACVGVWTHVMARRRVRIVEAVARRIIGGELAGEVRGALDTDFVDLHEAIVRMQSTLDEGIASLRRTRDARRRLFADLAHELATPLSTVFAILAALAAPPRQPRHMALLRQELARLARLVDDIQDLARLDDPRTSLVLRAVDLAELARTVTARVELLGADAPAFTVRAPEPVAVRADPQRVEQVLMNLLVNARRHGPVGGAVRVTVAREGDVARVTVDDDGPGVADDALARLGERMFRADPSRSAKTGGHGLGLSIAVRIVQRHGGAVTFARSPLGGLRASLTLPRAGPTGP